VAVEHFLLKKISFGSIYRIVRDTLEQYPEHNANSLEEKLLVDKEVRELVRKDLNTRRWG
jgi:1-deoxy-D-xylulose 5-phosphate reductoisomerase